MTERLTALGVTLGVEAALAALASHSGRIAEGAFSWAAVSGVLFALFLYVRPLAAGPVVGGFAPLPAPCRTWLAVHAIAAVLLFSAANASVLMAAALSAVVSGAFAAMPWRSLREAFWRAWRHAIAAVVTATAASVLFYAAERLEAPAAQLTYRIVRLALSSALGELVVHPEHMSLGTRQYAVILTPSCSGVWGVAIFAGFFLCWIVVSYDRINLSRALALLPAGMLLQYLMNALRIVAMVLIGNAGAPKVAGIGFHNNAGWITVLATGVALLVAAARVPGVYKTSPARSEDEYGMAPYLAPFLAILAAGLLAGAMSNGFEWAYALRVFTAGAVLWKFRSRYRNLDFRSGWIGPLTGAAVFAVWIAADSWMGHSGGSPRTLAESPHALQSLWILFRITGAVITVPIAEELAFRGLLLRQYLARPRDASFLRRVPYVALAGSSLIFGLMHGGPWLAATAAGLLYGLATCWRGRLGESIAAHATTNALLAGYVLLYGHWNLW